MHSIDLQFKLTTTTNVIAGPGPGPNWISPQQDLALGQNGLCAIRLLIVDDRLNGSNHFCALNIDDS